MVKKKIAAAMIVMGDSPYLLKQTGNKRTLIYDQKGKCIDTKAIILKINLCLYNPHAVWGIEGKIFDDIKNFTLC